MPHYISSLIEGLPQLLENEGYWILGMIVVLEGLPVIGSFFPGHVAIISAGFLVKIGVLNLAWVLTIAIIMTTVGDILGFLLGRKYGYSFLTRFGKYIFLTEVHIEKAKRIIDKHTGKAIVLGKFSPVTRALIPFIVGASGVHINKFWIFNIIGSALWVICSIAVGYIFGASYDVIAGSWGKIVFATVITTLLILWIYHLINTRFHVFKKYELFVLALNIISLWALAKTIQDSFSAHSFIANFDISVNYFLSQKVPPILINLSYYISMIGGTGVMIVLGLIVGFAFFIHKKYRRSAIMILSVTSSSVAIVSMKEFFMRMRPENTLEILNNASFPSGHAGLSAAFFVALVYVLAPRIKSWVRREVLIVLCVFAVMLIGLSRLILSAHWASDIVAGWSLGTFLATASILLVRFFGGFFEGIIRKDK